MMNSIKTKPENSSTVVFFFMFGFPIHFMVYYMAPVKNTTLQAKNKSSYG